MLAPTPPVTRPASSRDRRGTLRRPQPPSRHRPRPAPIARGLALAVALALPAGLLSGCSGDGTRETDTTRAGSATPATPLGWPVSVGDAGAQRYSSAAQITPANVGALEPAWSWATGERERVLPSGETVGPDKFQATPLAIGDTLILSTPFNRVVALDGRDGRLLWSFDPDAPSWGLISNDHAGFVHRGVATWVGDGQRRVFLPTRWELLALDAATGALIDEFGDGGRVDLAADLRWPADRLQLGNTSPPAVWRDRVIVGGAIGDNIIADRDPPGAVQAFEARSGERLWRWDPVPAADAPEGSTWGGDSLDRTGHANVWTTMTVDTARGLIYVPVSAASNDWYGGRRPGDNLYTQSLVCLDAATGELVWYRQLVHHDLWDYDQASPPVLVAVDRDGAEIDAVFVAGKTGFLYAFERTTGEPLWPLEERAVPATTVPDEEVSPTQPQPSWPEPFARQGFTTDDLVDFTPELRARAEALVAPFRLGPIFTPPSLEGTVVSPGWIGGAGWGAVAIDPERQRLYVKASNSPVLGRLVATGDSLRYRLDPGPSDPGAPLRLELQGERRWIVRREWNAPLPVWKPPYGTLSAYDLGTGERLYTVTLGDTPWLRDHSVLRDLDLPPLGVQGAPGPVATASGLLFVTGGGDTLYAIDGSDGGVLWSAPLGRMGYSNPMTYVGSDGRQYVVVATGLGEDAHLQAFVLPHTPDAD